MTLLTALRSFIGAGAYKGRSALSLAERPYRPSAVTLVNGMELIQILVSPWPYFRILYILPCVLAIIDPS